MSSPPPDATLSPASARGVFLSYASQDADAARRICETLRTAGIEVWFDQNELVGGDAWDAKIRGQIASCALFVPMISAATQARLEGYFRLEWKLAAQRTLTMADEKAFILPIVIDATRDADAKVPAEFKAVQWTRLRPLGLPAFGGAGGDQGDGGQARQEDEDRTLTKFAARVKALLDGEIAPTSSRPSEIAGKMPALPPKVGRRVPAAAWATAIIAIAAVAAFVAFRPKSDAGAANRPPTSGKSAAAPLSPAQELVAKARTILHEGDEMNRETYTLAEELLLKAESLDVAEASAWALHAELSAIRYTLSLDRSATRLEALRTQAERAMRLAPGSVDAQLASAHAQFAFGQFGPALESSLQSLAQKFPDEWRIHRLLGRTFTRGGKTAEALAASDRALQLRSDEPRLKADRVNIFISAGRFAEAQEEVAQALKGRTDARLLSFDVYLRILWSGDLPAALAATQSWPPWFFVEDRGASYAATAALWSRDNTRALEIVLRFPRDYIRDFGYTGPKAVLSAWAHEQAGHAESARADWRIVLQLAERELGTEPDNAPALHWKAWALARLGDTTAATNLLLQLEERNPVLPGLPQLTGGLGGLALMLGRTEDAIAQIARIRLNPAVNVRPISKTVLRLNPLFDPLRGDPRFQALVDAAPGPSLPSPPRVLDSASDKSVAVLAFADQSPARDSEYFSDGISDELINVLGKIPGLKVSARTSSFYFKGKSVPPAEIAKQLGVAYLVEGSVQRIGERVKITARLSKAADGFQLWNDSFTRDAKDVFAVEEEIAGLIAKQLSLKLGARSATSIAAIKPEAFELYLQGVQAWNQRTPAGYDRAEQLLTRTLSLEPNFARAHAALANVWLVRGQETRVVSLFSTRHSAVQQEAMSKIRHALTLDPESAEAHSSVGLTGWIGWEFAAGERALRHALQLNPNYASAHQWLGRLLLAQGRIDEALTELKTATELDPLSTRVADNYALALLGAGRLSAALAAADQALAIQPRAIQAMLQKARVLHRLGRDAEGHAILRGITETEWPDLTNRIDGLANGGLRAEANALLPKLDRDTSDLALILAYLGRTDEALAALNPANAISIQIDRWLLEPAIDSMRSDPRFAQFIATLGLTEAHARAQVWRAAHPPEKAAPRP